MHFVANYNVAQIKISLANNFRNLERVVSFQDIMSGKCARIPVYDFKTNARVPGEFTTIYPSDVVVVEGILVFYFPGIRNTFNLKLFVDTDADTRLARWIFYYCIP